MSIYDHQYYNIPSPFAGQNNIGYYGALEARIAQLERRIAALEAKQPTPLEFPPIEEPK